MLALPEASYSELRLCPLYRHERAPLLSIIGQNRKADVATGELVYVAKPVNSCQDVVCTIMPRDKYRLF